MTGAQESDSQVVWLCNDVITDIMSDVTCHVITKEGMIGGKMSRKIGKNGGFVT
jgi:hypothetical protein